METQKLGHTIADVTQMLRCTKQLVQRHIKSGDLVAINIASGCKKPRWIIRDADLTSFLESRTTKLVERK